MSTNRQKKPGRTILGRVAGRFAGLTAVVIITGLSVGALCRLPIARAQDSPAGAGLRSPGNPLAAATTSRSAQIAHRLDFSLPIAFEPNLGQTAGRVKFLSRAQSYGIFITPDETVITLDGVTAPHRKGQQVSTIIEQPRVIRVRLIGADNAQKIDARDQLPGHVNYLVGADPAGWHTDVPLYRSVTQHGVWPGIDLVYYGNSQRQIESDFVVGPEADPRSIRLAIDGSDGLTVDRDGNLLIAAGRRFVTLLKPRIYQRLDGRDRTIEGHYVLDTTRDRKQVRFEVASYDRNRPLVIDPQVVLDYSSFLGGSASDEGYGIVVDSNGNAYVTGRTRSPDFPAGHGTLDDEEDAFVTKFSTDGTSLVYSTLIGGTGGSGFSEGFAIAVSSDGHAYITGVANTSNFPTTTHAFQLSVSHGGGHPFVSELSVGGASLVFSTYVASNDHTQCQASDVGTDWGTGIAVDPAGGVYITGITCSSHFPLLLPLQYSDSVEYPASFVTELDSNGRNLYFSTYLGGNGFTQANAIAIDPNLVAPAIYVAGSTDARTFPTKNAYQAHRRGPSDAFLVKYAATDCGCVHPRPLVYSTFLGGSADDEGLGLAVDSSAHAYVVGNFFSSNFPFTTSLNPDREEVYPASFITKFSENGRSLLYSDWLGGDGDQSINAIALFGSDAYITGYADESFFPTVNAFEDTPQGGNDVFVSKISHDGTSLVYSTRLGGSGNEVGKAIAVGPHGGAYVTGYTKSLHYPLHNAFQVTNVSGTSAFITKLELGSATSPTAAPQ